MVRDTIQIQRDDRLYGLVDRLEREGHHCAVFDTPEDIPRILGDPRTKLLLAAAPVDLLARVALAIRAARQERTASAPALVYVRGELKGGEREWLTAGIDDFILDPFQPSDLLLRVHRLTTSDEDPASPPPDAMECGRMVGQAPTFRAAVGKLPAAATSDAPVLLTGETGTGKELCAQAIHRLSRRREKPFVAVNCGAIPVDLFEDEMFGHEAGAFTDARRGRPGLVAEGDEGTLFLDEVECLAPAAQVKLLRFLQDRSYKPLGCSRTLSANVRIVAATNEELEGLVRQGRFRQDLYYRLKVVPIRLPPLRERTEDILPLAVHFLRESAREYRRSTIRLSESALRRLQAYPWPGNVRELENVIRQAVILATDPVIRAETLDLGPGAPPAPVVAAEPFRQAKARLVHEFERSYLKEILDACGGNISEAARRAQKHRRAFFALLKKHGLTSGPSGAA